MSPQRRRWLTFIGRAKGDLDAVASAALGRLGGHDTIALTRDEVRDVSSLVALCEHAAVLCDRLRSSLSNEATDTDMEGDGEAHEA